MVRVDNHNHIILADIGDMVESARAKKLDRYSITEHVSQFRGLRESVAFGSVHSRGRIFEDLKEYREEFSRVEDSALSGMKIRMGLEVDFSPRFEAKVAEFVNQEKWDVLLCSVHELGDGTDIEAPRLKLADTTEAGRLWREYFELQQMALESDFVPFSVLTHPTRMAKGTNRLPEDMDGLLLNLAKTARGRDKALELNGKDLAYAPELVDRVARACSKADCKVSLGSDSHHPQDVFRNMEVAVAMVEELGLGPI